jgi:hypothetical protein
MTDLEIAKYYYLKGAYDADKTSNTEHITKDFETQFELIDKSNLHIVNRTFKEKETENIEVLDTVFIDANGVEKILLNKITMTVEQYRKYVDSIDENQP